MRLLNTTTIQLEEFVEETAPEYAILSHTWEEEEVSFRDIQTPEALTKKGYRKIQNCCRVAAADGYKYCWIDTCCIDKSSSAELSEAINSMFRWYQKAHICYAYLPDVFKDPVEQVKISLEKSRWFTRGWTLQELIAPAFVQFFDKSWKDIGTKATLHEQITQITGIPKDILLFGELSHRNTAERMS